MNGKWARIWKVAVVAYLRYTIPASSRSYQGKQRKDSAMTVVIPTAIFNTSTDKPTVPFFHAVTYKLNYAVDKA
jgi:hypothetical protein